MRSASARYLIIRWSRRISGAIKTEFLTKGGWSDSIACAIAVTGIERAQQISRANGGSPLFFDASLQRKRRAAR